jgi:DNA-binding SARP family transcriptional activator
MAGGGKMTLDVGILGPLEVRRAGRRVALGGPRQRAVLARLALEIGNVVAADRLIEDVWDGCPPSTARKTLQKYVCELRKALPDGTLRTGGGGYGLDLDAAALDARRFERAINRGDLDTGLALWRGDVLADLPEAHFADPERTRLGELRLTASELRLEHELARGRHAEAVACLAELSEAHPLREGLVGLHMLALYRSGRQVEALRAFEGHRRLLAEEIGVEPGAEAWLWAGGSATRSSSPGR